MLFLTIVSNGYSFNFKFVLKLDIFFVLLLLLYRLYIY
jgi:hypothetical protein